MAADYQQYDYIEKRLRYFDGQFLKDQDFIDEQKYHIDRHRRPLRQLHVSGIVEGLTVEQGSLENPDEISRATVMPGTAIDRQGRQLVLGSPRNVALKDFVKQSGILLEVYISYQEIASDLAAQDNDSHRRWHEQPLITVIEMDESGIGIPENGIRLGVVTLDDLGQVTVQDVVRRYAGIHLPSQWDNPSEQGLTLRSTGMNGFHEATLTGKLTVTGGLDVSGTIFVTEGLNVLGTVSFTQGLNVSGTLSATEDLTVLGTLSSTRMVSGTLSVTEDLTVLGTLSSTWVGIGTKTPNARLDIPGTEESTLLSVGATSGSIANIDLCGHVQFKEYSTSGVAYLQARDDKSNRDIGLRFRTQLKGVREKTLVEALTIEPSGKISSPMWRVTELFNAQAFNGNISANFVTGGGTLVVMASGSGYRGSIGPIGMNVSIDTITVGSPETWTNEVNSHKSFVATFTVVRNINPGSHTLSLIPFPNTVVDVNDRCSVTILELPF
jgi:hypothetical protein